MKGKLPEQPLVVSTKRIEMVENKYYNSAVHRKKGTVLKVVKVEKLKKGFQHSGRRGVNTCTPPF